MSSENDQELYDCLVQCICQPVYWDDHITVSKCLLAEKLKILDEYFPEIKSKTITYDTIISNHNNRILIIKLLSEEPVNVKIGENKVYLTKGRHEQLNVDRLTKPSSMSKINPLSKSKSDTKTKIVEINFYNISSSPSCIATCKCPLSELASQYVYNKKIKANAGYKDIEIAVQYLYDLEVMPDVKKLFPNINDSSYQKLLLIFKAVTKEPKEDVSWIIDEFCRQFGIERSKQNFLFLKLVMKSKNGSGYECLPKYTMEHLILILKEMDQSELQHLKYDVKADLDTLLQSLRNTLKRFTIAYPYDSVYYEEGSINAIIRLIKKISPDDYKDIIIESINDYIEFTYGLFKNNDEDDAIPSTSSRIAVLAQTTQSVIDALITFEKEYAKEFSQFIDMLAVLAVRYYEKLSVDIESTFREDIIVTEEMLDLHNKLYNLHTVLTTCKLVNVSSLLKLHNIFGPLLVKYLNNLRIKLIDIVTNIVNNDDLKRIEIAKFGRMDDDNEYGNKCSYSNGIVSLFSIMVNCSNYIFQFKFDISQHKLHVMQIAEDICDIYIRKAKDKYYGTLQTGSTIINKKVYVLINNILVIKPQYNSLQNLLNFGDMEKYDQRNIDGMINISVNEILEKTVESLVLDSIIIENRNNVDQLINYLDDMILKSASKHLPVDLFFNMLNLLWDKLINTIEDLFFSSNLKMESFADVTKFLGQDLDDLIRFFSGNSTDVDDHVMLEKRCENLRLVNKFVKKELNLNDVVPINVFTLVVIDPIYPSNNTDHKYTQNIYRILKSAKRLNYRKDQMIYSYSGCVYKKHKGYIFLTKNSVDFISRKGRKIISFDIDNIVKKQMEKSILSIDGYEFKKVSNDFFGRLMQV